MRRFMMVVGLGLVIGLVGQEVFAQRQGSTGGASSNQAFSVGSSTGGQGSSGNFGVGTAGQTDTSARFMRDNRNGAFVGADSSDTSFVGAADSSAQNSRSTRRGGGGSSRSNANRNTNRGRQQDEIRMVLKLGFTVPKAVAVASGHAPATVAARLVGRMERSSWIQNRSPIEISIDDQGTATLRGLVATDHDRALAEQMTLLEGGIWRVENLLKVETAPPADSVEVPALLDPTPGAANE